MADIEHVCFASDYGPDEPRLQLGKRATAAPGWRWMPGMLTMCSWVPRHLPWAAGGPVSKVRPARVTSVNCDGDPWAQFTLVDESAGGWGGLDCPGHPPVPDLEDPATLGCLLALVRERHGEFAVADMDPYGGAPRWWVRIATPSRTRMFKAASTEAGALVLALEESP